MSKKELTQKLNSKRCIVIDTETTGLKPGDDEILQLSIVDSTGTVLYNCFFRPEYKREWPFAERVHGISFADVADSPRISEERDTINSILAEAEVIIGYNTVFDLAFLDAAGLIHHSEIVDVMREFALVAGRRCKLTECAAYYGYDWKQSTAHNSLADCFATLFCCFRMAGKAGKEVQKKARERISDEERSRRREMGLPITKPLRYMERCNGSYNEVSVVRYKIIKTLMPSSTHILSVSLANNETKKIMADYFAEMQQSSFVCDMEQAVLNQDFEQIGA